MGPVGLHTLINGELLGGFLNDFKQSPYTQAELMQASLLQAQDWLKLSHPQLLALFSSPDYSKSQELKLSGNAKYAAGKFLAAADDYSLALHLIATQDPKLAATLYHNRSSCFRHLGKLQHALNDCVQALEVFPDYVKAQNLRAEVLFAMGRATLKDFEGFELTKGNVQHRKQLSESHHQRSAKAKAKGAEREAARQEEEEEYYSNDLRVSCSAPEGRYLTVAKDVERGTLLLREEPLACVVRHAKRNHLASLLRRANESPKEAKEGEEDGADDCCCGWCHRSVSVKCGSSRVAACFPCAGCVAACYCSTKCREADWAAHRHECGHLLLPHLSDELLLALRLAKAERHSAGPSVAQPTAARPNGGDVALHSLLPQLELAQLLELQFQALLFVHYVSSSSSSSSSSTTSSSGYSSSSSSTVSSSALAFSAASSTVLPEFPSSTFSYSIFAQIFHALCQVRANAFSVTELQEEEEEHEDSHVLQCAQTSSALAIFRTASLMNHSCIPNTAVSFHQRCIIVRAAEGLSAGSPVLHCYGPQHGEMGTNGRKALLREQYGFECRCAACARANDSFEWLACQVEGCDGALAPPPTPPSSVAASEAPIPQMSAEPTVKVHYENSTASPVSATSGTAAAAADSSSLVSPSTASVDSAATVLYAAARVLTCSRCGVVVEGAALNRLRKFEAAAQQYFEQGVSEADSKRAESVLLHCLELRERLLFRHHRKLGETHDALGRVLSMQRQWKGADVHVTHSIRILKAVFGEHSVQVGRELLKLAQLKHEQRLLRESAALAQESLRCLQHFALPETQRQLLQALSTGA